MYSLQKKTYFLSSKVTATKHLMKNCILKVKRNFMFQSYSKQNQEVFVNILTKIVKNIYTEYSKNFNKNEKYITKNIKI